ncbi:TlpA family protein disulfide reductase [Arcticibacterium luteifluviistationis]|uniref:Thioredoxin domain-containing protein n=1 Tax=Arcticibacterium luteifluviistationis TaxID=1784714 RepID=A0A2Z4G7H6_9BACT|nr:TlpA disulfide reductase family protein [Arcticibacterium luteifluviistationis]AWV97112.1 hypothetical protein DJ013_02550 [Arcticibacterium luteifluviistationis]
MKKALLFLIILSTYSCNKSNDYFSSELISECPEQLEDFKTQNIDAELKFTELETGLDSLKFFFGSITKNNKTDYWIASNFKGNNGLRGVSLKPTDSLNFLSEDITLEINPFDPISPYSVSLRILHEPSTNTVQYLWLKNGLPTKTATFVKVEKPILQGKEFPEISIKALNGETISSKDFKNKIIVINWWSTSCSPCVKEIPELNGIFEKYKSYENILFLAITNDTKDRVLPFLEKHNFKYTQGLGRDEINEVFKGFQPQNIIINKHGVTELFLAGYIEQTPSIIDKTIEQLLEKK